MNRLVLLLLLLAAPSAFSVEEPAQTGGAAYQILFNGGFYEEAARYLEARLKDKPDTLFDEYRKVLAFSYIMMRRPEAADSVFRWILRDRPSYGLDPITTSPKFFDIFSRTRNAWVQSDEGKEALRRQEALLDSLRQVIALANLPFIERYAVFRTMAYCLPAGTGQFWNKQPRKGVLLGALQAVALGGSLFAWQQRRNYYGDYGWYAGNEADNRRMTGLMRIQFGVFVTAYAVSVFDAFRHNKTKEKK